MANVYAIASGNWSATSTWTGGTLPGPTDTAIAGGFNVTIDQDIEVVEIKNAGVPNGGQFLITSLPTLPAIRTLDCSIATGGPGDCLVLSATSGTLTITGDVRGQSASNSDGLVITAGGCTVNIGGNVYAGSSATAHGVNVTAGPTTLNIAGSVYGGLNNSGCGVSTANSGMTVDVTVTGSAYGGLNAAGHGINHLGSYASVVTVQGDAVASAGRGVNATQGATTIDVQGTCYASATASAVAGAASPTGSNHIKAGGLVFASNGRHPVIGPIVKLYPNAAVTFASDNDFNPLVKLTPTASGFPTAANVRSGTSFGASSELTGTMAIPAASDVLVDVPVGSTVGTATLPLSDVASITGTQITAATGG